MKRSSTTRILLLFLAFFAILAPALQAQSPTLSVQGVLKKSDGSAVDDNTYNITFTLWKSEAGTGSADKAWRDTIPVETKGGVYSAVLGSDKVLDAPFDGIYYLGVQIAGASQELRPRPRLTHAPYAMSLLGKRNKFPSEGTVLAETILADTISLDAIKAPNDTVEVASNLNLAPGKSIQYKGLSDWRLVAEDDFKDGMTNGWASYTSINNDNPGGTALTVAAKYPDISAGLTDSLLKKDADPLNGTKIVLKKTYNFNNTPHTKIKVVFSVYTIDDDLSNRYDIYVGSSNTDMANLQRLVYGRNEVVLNTVFDSFVLGLGSGDHTSEHDLYLDDIEIWVK
jgi:hypothetical protein